MEPNLATTTLCHYSLIIRRCKPELLGGVAKQHAVLMLLVLRSYTN
jgi:hypothetical protein